MYACTARALEGSRLDFPVRSGVAFCLVSARSSPGNGVNDGNRTRDLQDHNLALCQLSYIHHGAPT